MNRWRWTDPSPARSRPPCARTARGGVFALFAACAEHALPQESADGGGPMFYDAHDAASAEAGIALDANEPDAHTADADFGGARDAVSPDAGTVSAAQRVNIVVPERWQILDAASDLFDDRPANVQCLAAGVMPETLSEERVLGVETGYCQYLSAHQPTRLEVKAGEVLKVRLWHFVLSAPEPAEAHAAVVVDGLTVLDERVSIPSPGGLLVRELLVERAIPAGAPVHFHLHNHGENSWALVEVSAGPGK
jgi:hypothetical protein